MPRYDITIASALRAIGTPADGTAFHPHLSSATVLHPHPHSHPHPQIPRPSPPLSLSYNVPFPSSASAFLVPVLRIATYDPDVTAPIAPSTDVSDVPTFSLNINKSSRERKEGLLWWIHVLPTRLCCQTHQLHSFYFSGSFVSRVLSNRGHEL